MAEGLGLKEVVAMGVGGVVGGGIFAVLGVAARISGNAAFLSYGVAGLIALASGYSYVKMTEHLEEEGGSFTFLEHYVSNKNIAGMVGWILIIGYIGTMAIYAYAFGSFTVKTLGIPHGSLLRGLISIGIVLQFLVINFLGVRNAGVSEDLLVYVKVAVLLGFAALGAHAIVTRPEFTFFSGGIFDKGVIAPIIGIGTIFVSFEGWQLLTYEYSDIRGGAETLKKGVISTILISTLLYILIALVTTSLVSTENIIQHKEAVLAFAAKEIFASTLAQAVAGGLVSLAALFSTASAINATLFGTARFTHKIAADGELPQVFSFKNKEGIPTRSLLIISVLTAAFTFLGSLKSIATFASISFVMIFGVVNFVAYRDEGLQIRDWVPLTGFAGTAMVFLLEIYHLVTEEVHLFLFIAGIYSVLLLLEFLYFEREELEKEAEQVEEEVEKVENEVKEEEEELKKEIENIEEDLDEDVS